MGSRLFFALGLAVWLNAGEAHAACDPPLKDFRDLAAQLETMEEIEDQPVLNAELIEDPATPCAAVWIVEVLGKDDDVLVILLDAQSFERLDDIPDYVIAAVERGEPQPASEEIFIVSITVTGGPNSDMLEGGWSDDVMTGGRNVDVFMLTPGIDLITDFEPARDVLSMLNFSFGEFGFGTLSDIAAVRAAARLTDHEGAPATVIDLDGEAGDWAVALVGVFPGQLSERNVIFKGAEELDRRVAPTKMAAREVAVSDGSVIELPAYALDSPPAAPRLISGTEEALQSIRRTLGFEE